MDDTIAAVATAPGKSFTAVVRMSGQGAISIADDLIGSGPRPGNLKGFSAPETELALPGGRSVCAGLLVMRRPFSYTVEDMVEFHIPGSGPLVRAVLAECLRLGARLAGPGEFTRRAFLNGRIDEVQVEGVLSLIESRSDEQRAAAMERLKGRPSREAAAARDRLLGILADIEAYIDFTDEDTESFDEESLREELVESGNDLRGVLDMLGRRKPQSDLPGVVILGPPNAGKSSLFKSLVPGKRVIISSVPGTTRDLIRGEVHRTETAFRLYDAPGVTETQDPLERLAVANLAGLMGRIQVCLVLLDGSRPFDRKLLSGLTRFYGDRARVFLLNKADLGIDPSWKDVALPGVVHSISVLAGQGLEKMLDSVKRALPEPRSPGTAALDAGYAIRIKNALHAVDRALEEDWISGVELVAMEIRDAFSSLGGLSAATQSGDTASEELLNAVFSRFCIGK